MPSIVPITDGAKQQGELTFVHLNICAFSVQHLLTLWSDREFSVLLNKLFQWFFALVVQLSSLNLSLSHFSFQLQALFMLLSSHVTSYLLSPVSSSFSLRHQNKSSLSLFSMQSRSSLFNHSAQGMLSRPVFIFIALIPFFLSIILSAWPHVLNRLSKMISPVQMWCPSYNMFSKLWLNHPRIWTSLDYRIKLKADVNGLH